MSVDFSKLDEEVPSPPEHTIHLQHSDFIRNNTYLQQKHYIPEFFGFDLVQITEKKRLKRAYGEWWPKELPDFEIVLHQILTLEHRLDNEKRKRTKKKSEIDKILEELKDCYRLAVRLMAPEMVAGWNRWSENILHLFVSDKLKKILWGSGNCGKSATCALLLYIKWRVNPEHRMVVLAAKVVKDASARVWGYLKGFHVKAPESTQHIIKINESGDDHGIFHMYYKEEAGKKKLVRNTIGCIATCPVKTNAKEGDIGGNLLGRHPKDKLILAFDEAQELPGNMLKMKIFANWLTNDADKLDIIVWGNPQPVDFHLESEQDLLYQIAATGKSKAILQKWAKKADQTFIEEDPDKMLLHLSMLDSPRDDPDEINNYVEVPGGQQLRLHFIAGKDNAEAIAQTTTPNSAAWFSQVLGFPFIDYTGATTSGVITPYMISMARKYPLHWVEHRPHEYFMGVDPSITPNGDDFSIIVGRISLMQDNRIGLDLMNGDWCRVARPEEGKEFVDSGIDTMWEISKALGIPLRNIAIETHGSGEVIRYALARRLEQDGYWASCVAKGDTYEVVNPRASTSDLHLFKVLGNLKKASEICGDCVTENWVAVRCMFMTRQIFNVPDWICDQGMNRILIEQTKASKYKLEKKDDMRSRGLGSPDHFDALANLVYLIRRRGFSYKYIAKDSYTEHYGAQWKDAQTQKQVEKNMGIVGRMLGVPMVQNANRRDVGTDLLEDIILV